MTEPTKYALVTGGSRGIGREICLKLARSGYYVLINYRSNADEAQRTLEGVRAAGGDGETLRFDVAAGEETAAAIAAWQERHKGAVIEVVVNNAGIRSDTLMMWMEPQQWHSVVDTGLGGFYNVTRPLLKDMLVKRFGRIVNIVSLSGIKGLPGQTNYSAAKGGVIAATKALAQEVAKKRRDGKRHRAGIRTHGHDRRPRRSGTQKTDTRRTLLRGGGGRRSGDVPHLGQGLLHHGGGDIDQRRIIHLTPWKTE